MLMRKLVWNFLEHGKITTTLPKARALKSYLDRLVYKAREKNEANKNVLLSHIVKKEWVEFMFEKVGPFFKDRIGGYVRIVKLLPRESDGAAMARVEWVENPVATKKEEKKGKSKKKEEKKEEKIEAKEKSKVEVESKNKNAKTD